MSDCVLTCKNLCKSYKFPVLKDLNVTLPNGRIIGMELVRRGIDEELANKLANSIEVVVESFEAGVGIIEEDED